MRIEPNAKIDIPMKYDLVVIGSGPGGYIAALQGAHGGLKHVAIVEREALGGVCLNFGCIPTKALLHSAHVCETVRNAADFGVVVEAAHVNFPRVIERSREVAASMSKGVLYLLNKAGVDIVRGEARLLDPHQVEVTHNGEQKTLEATNIIIATGARPRELPQLPIDGRHIIGYREALTQQKRPATLAVIGSGAIGSELALFYNAMGTEVTLIEALPQLLPLEDEEVSKAIGRAFRKAKIKTMVGAKLLEVKVENELCTLSIETSKGVETLVVEQVLSAVGIQANTEGLGLEGLGIATERGRILVNDHFQTSVPSVYAIGDVIPTIALAHVASAEAVACVDYILDTKTPPMRYDVVPACIYTTPEIGSVGLRERQAKELGIDYLVGNFPFTASGKATAMASRDGFVKLLFRKEDHVLIGAHIVGASATEMIAELALAMGSGVTVEALHSTIHPHPTLSEAVAEAAAQALGHCLHL